MNSTHDYFRIRLGVTGHRVLSDEEPIARKIKEVLVSEIPELLEAGASEKHRKGIAFTILTSLAEGADRLVAREALKLPGTILEVVLPLTKEDYLQDFKTAGSRNEFEELCGLAGNVMTLKSPPHQKTLSSSEYKASRERAYELAGRYVATHCDVLIAIWDGKPSQGRGGTAETVAFARELQSPLIVISANRPVGIKHEIGKGLNRKILNR
jgi:hypothetical protein